MATPKKAAKPIAKKAAVKKATPGQKVAPPRSAVKSAPVKQSKPVAKSAHKPKVNSSGSSLKNQSKPAQKTPVKTNQPKQASKLPAGKSKTPVKVLPKNNTTPAKSINTPSIKKPVTVQKPVQQLMPKKSDEKKPAPKEAPAKPAAIKAIAKNPKDIKVAPAKPVVIPKFNTKTSRKYQPDFTKSVLDQVKNDPGAPIVRYNDTDLLEFRELIQRKLEAAKKELNYLQGLITRKDEMGGDESENRYMTMEDGSLSMEREQLSQMASRQITFIDHLEKAIMRIENKTYGICRVTGKLIDKARLRAVPHATLSIEAKMGIVK